MREPYDLESHPLLVMGFPPFTCGHCFPSRSHEGFDLYRRMEGRGIARLLPARCLSYARRQCCLHFLQGNYLWPVKLVDRASGYRREDAWAGVRGAGVGRIVKKWVPPRPAAIQV